MAFFKKSQQYNLDHNADNLQIEDFSKLRKEFLIKTKEFSLEGKMNKMNKKYQVITFLNDQKEVKFEELNKSRQNLEKMHLRLKQECKQLEQANVSFTHVKEVMVKELGSLLEKRDKLKKDYKNLQELKMLRKERKPLHKEVDL